MNQLEEQLEGAKDALDSIVSAGLLDRQRGGGFPYPNDERLPILSYSPEVQILCIRSLTALMSGA